MSIHTTIKTLLRGLAAGTFSEDQVISSLSHAAEQVRDTPRQAALYQQAIADLREMHAAVLQARLPPWRRGLRPIALLPGQSTKEAVEAAFPHIMDEIARANPAEADTKPATGTIGAFHARKHGESYTISLDQAAWTNVLSLVGYAWASAMLASDTLIEQGAAEMRSALYRAEQEASRDQEKPAE